MTQNDFRTEVDGAEALDRSLTTFADDVGDMRTAGEKAGQAVRIRASSLAPVDTGALARSIRAEATGTEVTVGTPIPYAPFQEYGTNTVPASPYLRPALEAATGLIVDGYRAEVDQKLGKVKGA
jgi:HK97 gp10 family phage protein